MLNDDDLERYARQAIMPAIGEDGQERLLATRMLIVGAGGLGAPVLLYLAAAGVGHLTIIDDDSVSLSDLNRQIIYKDRRIGQPKAEEAARAAAALNPFVQISHHSDRLTADNAAALFRAHDMVIDCTDNADTRYLLGDAAHHYQRPLVFGGAVRMEGQVSVFQSSIDGHQGSPCYRCVFPSPAMRLAPHLEAGILGQWLGVGTMQALEAIKLALGLPDGLTGRLLLIDAAGSQFMDIATAARSDCSCCGSG